MLKTSIQFQEPYDVRYYHHQPLLFKNHMLMFMMVVVFLFLLSHLSNVQGQTSDQQQNMPDSPQTVHPSKVLVISVLTIMFAITFLLLAYVKFCRINPLQAMNQNHINTNLQNGLARSGSRFSGINKEVIEALPFFKFSSLKGSKEGLECTVCLSKFEDSENLRLLPKCHHAFHMSCIDKWLESHSTCPLCRYKVETGDIKNINFSISSRFLRVPSNLTEDPNVEIYVQREPSNRGSSRFSIGSGLWEVGKSKKQEQPLIDDQEGDNSSGTGINTNTNTKWAQEHVHHHKLNHRIVISDVVTRSRWSDLNSSDLISLSYEMMLNDVSSPRFSPPLEPSKNNNGEKIHHGSSSSTNNNDDEDNSFTALNNPSTEKRSMSEITNVPRFVAGMRKQSRVIEYSGGDSERKEERLWRIWMPIAQRTVQWFARREIIRNSHQHKTLVSNV